jgi:hypothetical protein
MVYRSGGDDTPDAVFKRSWTALHKLGFAEAVVPAFEAKHKKKADEPETDPDKMTMKEFIAWREKQEDAKRGRPRQGFVHPKKRGENR